MFLIRRVLRCLVVLVAICSGCQTAVGDEAESGGARVAETRVESSIPIARLREQIRELTDRFPERPGPEAGEQDWDAWRAKDYEMRKRRLSVVEELEAQGLSDEVMEPYIQMALEDIRKCFHYARTEANKFEGKIYRMLEEGSPRAKMLAEELFWELNIYHVNTHAMSLSERDVQKIADFELGRKAAPEAGRSMAEVIRLANLTSDAKSYWSTWVLDNMPETSEGYQWVMARDRLKSGIDEVFEFSGEDLHGNTIASDKLTGQVVLIDFWAFWCGHCLAEMPKLKEIYEKHHEKGLTIIGVFNDNRLDELRDYVGKNGIAWPQLVNREAGKVTTLHPLAEKYGIRGLPRYFLVGPDGKLKASALRVEQLKPQIEELLRVN